MNYKNITVAGSGVLGYQIAFQTAFHGFNVTVYDINDEVLEKAKGKFEIMSSAFKSDLNASQQQLEDTYQKLRYSSNLEEAVKDADLLIEAVPENPQIKIGFYEQLAKVAPAKTVFATNSSTLLPSQFASSTGRPEKFVALHFANEIWKHNTAEIMGHPTTSHKVFNDVVEFAKRIGMLPLPLHKEQPGYILNSLLVPLIGAALDLYVNEVADVETIDKTWMVATGAPVGPFGILDVVGVTTAYNINKIAAEKTQDANRIKVMKYLEENFINKNKLGVATGEGFYTYPNPAFQKKDFLK
ncbi:3-hydroxyacyl-CoA dehydrogenase [Winogradskyella sp. SYSU M77433]|uniref:3-hydroxyacyl-CoA dehydrogenase n=1 Tax=Winogradskyella sp. SYSU M77433 TaxID=3042722 RepID=UPI0012385F47|nr:3-hydroxyacyl-CoA dehydrogenase [Winogradskyella sp. SYSU M77433]MDH7914668.1 3-hydroxyacyl-CoA dehydrogenase [Winogradskyella sp. SYSU M77433]|tara:strand:- start:195 stop:1091 length:897 start_codon:yes stop_codon:yes gene_type:complete